MVKASFFFGGGGDGGRRRRDLINPLEHGDNYVYHLLALSPHIVFMVFSMFI